MIKSFLEVDCKLNCPYSLTCCKVPTEVIQHEGRQGTDILIFGMGAGKDEEKQRRCFVGRSGKYMRSIIKHLWDTHGVFNLAISNNVRFHPMDENGKDREPTPAEISRCMGFLLSDILYLKPKAIIPVGKNAASSLLVVQNASMTALRGKIYNIDIYGHEYRMIPTWHPAYLCRSYGSFNPETRNVYDQHFISDVMLALES